MDDQLTLADLPRQNTPGDVGIRVTEEGVWIPIGLNVRATNGQQQYFMPQYQRRREWHQTQTLGGTRTPLQVRLSITKCSVCSFHIGRGFLQTELYARPVLEATAKSDNLSWKHCCGACAIRYFDLPHGFCVIADSDWVATHHEHIGKAWHTVWNHKIDLLEDAVFSKMFDFIIQAERIYWKQHRGNMKGFHRQPLLEEVAKIQTPRVATFTDIYPVLINRQRGAA